MATTTTRQALHSLLKTTSSITGLLASGADSIFASGRVPPDGPFPCLAIRHAGRSGGSRRLPFFDDVYYITCYDDAPTALAVSYYHIDAVLNAVRQAVHGASLTLEGQKEQVFFCHLDNFDSPDQWDFYIEKPYKSIRVRIPGVYSYDYRS